MKSAETYETTTVLVCGSRDWTDYETVRRWLDILRSKKGELEIVHGSQRGADLCAERWAKEREQFYRGRPAQFKRRGRRGGVWRNATMLVRDEPDLVIAFHEDIARSRGTVDMINRALARDLQVFLVDASGEMRRVMEPLPKAPLVPG